MRNLKRVLSLALALVMVLGMMVIGTSAATFTDDAEITNKEAVEVLNALGIIEGYNGAFNPTGNLNRAGAAKLIAFMTMGAEADNYLAGSAAPFTDVAADHWAAKYVAYCSNLKIINGNGDGTFNPDGNISTVGFAKLVLGAAGVEGTYTGDGWEQNVKNALEAADLDVVTVDNTDITREEAATLMLAGLKYSATAGGWVVVNKDGAVVKTFADALDAAVYANTLKTATGEAYTAKQATATDTLLNKVYKVKCEGSVDEYGRPGVRYTDLKTSGKTINLFYGDEAAAKYVGTFTKKIVEDMNKAAEKDLFAGATVVYNGYTSAGADAVAELYTPKGDAVNGLTVELYNTDTDAEIEKIVVIESNFATVKEVKATEGEKAGSVTITVSYYDAGKPVTTDVKYTDNLKSTTDDYDALVGYAKDTALIVTMGEAWDLLAVAEPTAVEGKITKIALGDYNCLTTVTIGGAEYGLNNLFANVDDTLTVGSEGTLYVDAQNNGLAWANKKDAETKSNVAYFVCGYVITVPASVDAYGQVTPAKDTYWAQYVTMTGETVLAQTKIDTSSWTPGMVEVSTSYDAKDKIDYTVFGAAKDVVKDHVAEIKATDIKIADGQYYADDVKFIFVSGAKDKLKVEVKEGVQAIAAGTSKLYIPAEIKGDTNKTVSVVIVAAKVEAAPVVASGVTYAAEAADSTTKVLYTDKDGKDAIGYEHTVYVDGVKTTIVTDSATKLAGFVTLTEVVTGVYKVAAVDLAKATNLKDSTAVVNMYKGMLTTKDVEDMAVAGAALVDVSGDKDATTDATKLTAEYDVALVLSADKKSIVTIYITDYTKA